MRRVSVVGTTGSGKTTLAGRLAEILDVPHVELDALHWEPGWTPADTGVFRERTFAAIAGDEWVVDGNYRQVRELVWERADTVVWLDLPFPVMFWRLTRRTLGRLIRPVDLWNGNRETWRSAFGRESLWLWQLRTFREKRTTYPERFADPRWSHLDIVRLRTPRAAEAWLEGLTVVQ